MRPTLWSVSTIPPPQSRWKIHMGRAKLWRLTYITAAARHTWTGGCSENRRPSGWTAKPLGKKNLWNISSVSIDSNEIKCTSRLILKSFSYRVSEEISAICSAFSSKVCNQKSEISIWTQSFLIKFSKVLVFSTKVCNQKPEISTWTQSFLIKFSKVLVFSTKVCNQKSEISIWTQSFLIKFSKVLVFSTKVCNQKPEISTWTQSFLIKFPEEQMI